DPLAERVLALEQEVADAAPDHRRLAALLDIEHVEEPARLDGLRRQVDRVWVDRVDLERVGLAVALGQHLAAAELAALDEVLARQVIDALSTRTRHLGRLRALVVAVVE